MIIDSPIISGSYSASGSYNQFGNVVVSGSLTVTGSIIGTASYAATASNALTASYLSGYVSPFPFTGSAIISGSLAVTGSILQSGSFTSTGTLTAQTLVVQTITSSVVYSSGSNIFGNDLANTQRLTGSVSITGSLAVNGSNAILTNQTSSMSASYALNATSASYANNATTASYANTSTSASYSNNSTSASYATTASFSLNVPVTASYANNANSASYAATASFVTTAQTASFVTTAQTASFVTTAQTASFVTTAQTASFVVTAQTASFVLNAVSSSFATSASQALTASYLSGYVSPFPFTGSAIISGSLGVTGSFKVTNLGGSGVRYLVADDSGSITAQSASAALKSTQAFTSTAGQTTFAVTNGYSTGYVDVFINGSKLATAEFTDTSGTNIVLATGSFINDTVEVVKYTPAAGVTNNVLRQLTTLTASAGQTVFSASYTPGLLDIFYNGARLTPADFTANNGTYFTLATASAANDILDVLVYSYQVGAFSGIGGTGVANQFAYFNTTNSITSSTAITISGANAIVTGSLLGTASYSNDAGTLDGLDSTVFTLTSSFNTITASLNAFSASVLTFTGSAATRLSALEAATASLYTATSSFSGRVGALEAATSSLYSYTSSLNNKTASFATTGSNTFIGTQTLTGSIVQSGSFTTTGTIIAQTINVQQVTSSVVYSCGNNIFGSTIGNTQVFTGSFYQTGSVAIFNSCVGIGTTSPASKFHVAGYGNTAGGNITIGCVNDSACKWSYLVSTQYNSSTQPQGFALIGGYSTAAENSIVIGGSIYEVNPATSIAFNTHTAVSHSLGGTEKMRITSCGYVGIGTTTPSGSLHICGSTYFGSRLILERTSGAVGRYSIGVSTGNNQFEITDEAQGNCTRLSIASTGFIGIGTTSPNRLLDVRGDAYFYASNTSYSEGISVFANVGSTSGAGINFHCAPAGTVASATTLRGYLRVNPTGTCMVLGVYSGSDLCAMFVNIANGNVKFTCGLTAATIGTNDLTLSNLNYERANYVDGTRGSWLIQEGACDLFIINQMSCKKYKFNLIEIQ